MNKKQLYIEIGKLYYELVNTKNVIEKQNNIISQLKEKVFASNNNIILVGNAPSILEKKLGEKIDSFDTVVRFNNFQIDGYEKFVGRKTDVWLLSIMSESHIEHKTNDFTRIIAVENWCKEVPQRVQWRKSLQNKYPNLEYISQDFSKSCSDIFNFERDKNWCTVGIIGILYFLQFYDKIYICGFADLSKKDYFEDKKIDSRNSMWHRYDLEKQLIEHLEEKGKVIIL